MVAIFSKRVIVNAVPKRAKLFNYRLNIIQTIESITNWKGFLELEAGCIPLLNAHSSRKLFIMPSVQILVVVYPYTGMIEPKSDKLKKIV